MSVQRYSSNGPSKQTQGHQLIVDLYTDLPHAMIGIDLGPVGRATYVELDAVKVATLICQLTAWLGQRASEEL